MKNMANVLLCHCLDGGEAAVHRWYKDRHGTACGIDTLHHAIKRTPRKVTCGLCQVSLHNPAASKKKELVAT